MRAKGIIFLGIATRAGVHGAPKRRVTTMDHFFYVFDDRVTRMLKINHFFKMVQKDFLQYIHKTIMKESSKKENPKSPHE